MSEDSLYSQIVSNEKDEQAHTAKTSHLKPFKTYNEKAFPEVPPPNFVEQFRAFVKETDEPELFEGLAWTKPQGFEGAVMLDTFKVKKKRDRSEYIACTYCNNVPKFLEGALMWFPDQKIRLIGHDCARVHGGDAYSSLRRTYREKVLFEKNTSFLLANLAKIRPLKEEAAKLNNVCYTIAEYRNRMKMTGGLHSFLSHRIKDGGRLSVVVSKRGNEAYNEFFRSGNSEVIEEVIHVLIGRKFLDTKFKPQADCASIVSFLDMYEHHQTEDALELVAELSTNTEALNAAAKALRDIPERILNLREDLSDAVMFFSLKNLLGLKKYRDNKNADLPFGMNLSASGVSFKMPDKSNYIDFPLGSVLHVPKISLPIWD